MAPGILLDRPCHSRGYRLYYRAMLRSRAMLTVAAARTVDFLFPERCIACGRFGKPLCAPCLARLQDLRLQHGCARCAAPIVDETSCSRCGGWDAIDLALPAFEYEGCARQMVHALKYGRQRSLIPVMARELSHPGGLPRFDAAFAVPLHPSRFRSRGFNQAERLLRELALPRQPGRLRRIRNTRSQVGLNPGDRRANVAGAFEYSGPSLSGCHAAIVDDVVTTGATANECARMLRAAGAAHVTVVSFARASKRTHDREPIDD